MYCTTWPALTLTGSSIRISDSLRILDTLSLDPHINNIVKNCNYHLQVLRHIRPSITKITVTLCSTKCLTKTSTNCSEFRIVHHELSVESVDGIKMFSSYVTTCTGYLATDFKLATLCFKSHVMRQPDYLAVTLDRCEPSRSLRSSTHNIFFMYHFVTLC